MFLGCVFGLIHSYAQFSLLKWFIWSGVLSGWIQTYEQVDFYQVNPDVAGKTAYMH